VEIRCRGLFVYANAVISLVSRAVVAYVGTRMSKMMTEVGSFSPRTLTDRTRRLPSFIAKPWGMCGATRVDSVAAHAGSVRGNDMGGTCEPRMNVIVQGRAVRPCRMLEEEMERARRRHAGTRAYASSIRTLHLVSAFSVEHKTPIKVSGDTADSGTGRSCQAQCSLCYRDEKKVLPCVSFRTPLL